MQSLFLSYVLIVVAILETGLNYWIFAKANVKTHNALQENQPDQYCSAKLQEPSAHCRKDKVAHNVLLKFSKKDVQK